MNYVINNGKNYIRINNSGTPIIVDKREAQSFEKDKAENIFKMLPRRFAKFHFSIKPVQIDEANEQVQVSEVQISSTCQTSINNDTDLNVETAKNYNLPSNVIEWLNQVKSLTELVQRMEQRRRELSKLHAEIEKKKIDIEHEIEFIGKLNACEGYKLYRKLKDVLGERRCIKDELFTLGAIMSSNLSYGSQKHLHNRIEGLQNRKYRRRTDGEVIELKKY